MVQLYCHKLKEEETVCWKLFHVTITNGWKRISRWACWYFTRAVQYKQKLVLFLSGAWRGGSVVSIIHIRSQLDKNLLFI